MAALSLRLDRGRTKTKRTFGKLGYGRLPTKADDVYSSSSAVSTNRSSYALPSLGGYIRSRPMLSFAARVALRLFIYFISKYRTIWPK